MLSWLSIIIFLTKASIGNKIRTAVGRKRMIQYPSIACFIACYITIIVVLSLLETCIVFAYMYSDFNLKPELLYIHICACMVFVCLYSSIML